MAEVDFNELERYLRIFQENPDSRVFAPLADLYRRLGRLKEAEEIVREGMERHPYYAGGKVAFAHILLDSGRYQEALHEAEHVVTYYPDNLLARKILIRVLGALSELDRAAREFEALKALAPQIASDPELERALHGPSLISELPESPHSPPPVLNLVTPAEAAGLMKSSFKPLELQGVTEWQLESPHVPPQTEPELQPHRSFRIKKLLKKKFFLETWLRVLDEEAAR